MMSDQLNPLFVYEIRQVVRNRALLALLCLYLVLLVVVFALAFQDILQNGLLQKPDAQLGRELTLKFLAVLFHSSLIASLAFCVFSTAHQGVDDELLYATPLKGKQALLGKLAVSALITMLFYCLTLPFLVIAWLFRGVDVLLLMAVLSTFFFVQQTITLYATGSIIGCRNSRDLWAGVIGMLFGMPACLVLWVTVIGFCFGAVSHARPVGAREAVVFVVFLISLALFTGSYCFKMYQELYKRPTRIGDRVFLAAGTSWMILFYTGLFVSFTNILSGMIFNI